jgi:ribosomal protein S18 acetylase RimI-like enzyme
MPYNTAAELALARNGHRASPGIPPNVNWFTALTTLPPFPGLPSLGLAAKRLDTCHEATVEQFCRRCNAFFTLITGESAGTDTARDLLVSRPPGVELIRKHVIGFERDGVLVAIVDLLESYPNEADWYVGLLLVSPDERARGVGTAVWTAVETWIRAVGGRQVRLIVQQQNPNAARFWRAVGFTADGAVEQHLPARTNLCWRFEKPLPGPLS